MASSDMASDRIEKALGMLKSSSLSNYEISKHIHISQSTLGNYKNGKTRPTPANAEILLQYFSKPEVQLNENEANEAVILHTNHILNVPLVNQYAHAGYLSGYADPEYVETLPTLPFIIDQEAHGNYIAFEVKGDSMDDGTDEAYKEGDRLLCREIQKHLWAESKLHIRKWDFVIVHKEGILVKRITDHNVEACTITIHSLNPLYPDRQLHLQDVRQIFNVIEMSRPRRR